MNLNVRLFVFVFSIFALSGAQSKSGQLEKSFTNSFFEALKYSTTGDFERAIEELKKCESIKPKNETILYLLAKNYLLSKTYVESRKYLIRLLQKYPKKNLYINLFYNLYKVQNLTNLLLLEHNQYCSQLIAYPYQKERLTELINTNKKPKPVSISRANTYKERLKLLVNQKKIDSVEIVSKKAIELYPASAYFYYTLGLSYFKKQNYKKAKSNLEVALSFIVEDSLLLTAVNNLLKKCISSSK